MDFVVKYLEETKRIAERLDVAAVARVVGALRAVRDRGGRLFIMGVGGGAGHASHAVCDLRKIGGFEAYCPSDNASELTARINDEGWDTSYAEWLRGSRLGRADGLLVFSVGGGDAERGISTNLVRAMDAAKEAGATVCAVVGRDGGHAGRIADACVIVPTVNTETITAHTEEFQAVVWHLLISHPLLKASAMKWESQR